MQFAKHWAATLDDYAIDLAWSSDGKLLAAASAAGAVTLYDATGAVVYKLAGHANGTNALAWIPVVGRTARALAPGSVPREPSTNISAQPEASPYLLATGGQDGKVKLWNAATGALQAEAALGDDWVEHLAWVGRTVPGEPSSAATAQPEASPYLFAAAGKKLVALRADGSVAHAFKDAPKTITALAFTGNALCWPAESPRSDRAEGGAAPVQPLIASAYFGGVCVWNATTFAAEKEFFYGNTIHALMWSPDGRWLVAGCQDNAVHLWAPAEDLELHMSGYETKLKELSFSRDSKWLATGGGRDACVWDCTGAGPEGREPLLLPHNARTIAVAFQHQHGLLATGAADGEFCLWSPTRKNPLIAEVKMPAAATKFSWSPDDTLLAVGTEKGSVFVFRVTA